MRLAARMGRIGESATLRVARRAKELRAAGREIVDLSAGEPDFDSPAAAVEAAGEALRTGFTRYTESNGIPELRSELAARYRARHGAPWGPNDFLVTVGGKAALFELALALVEEGDEVVIPAPCWVSFPEQVRFAGGEPVFVPTRIEDAFAPDPDRVIAAFSPRTRAVLLNSPSNPTGGVIPAPALRRIVEAAARASVMVVYDETYERFLYDGARHASAAALAAEYPETVAVVGSFSKTYAMTGWRIGWMAGPAGVVGAAAAIQSHATSNATSFAMVGAAEALRRCEADVERMIAEYQARRDLLIPRLNALPGFECPSPAGAFYAFPRVAALLGPELPDSVAFCEFLLEEAGVALVPGAAFGADQHVRLSFACSRDTLARGLERIAEAVAVRIR